MAIAVKRITEKQRANGMCWCERCKRMGRGKVRAEWHESLGDNYCTEHKPSTGPEHITLADEMTWMRL